MNFVVNAIGLILPGLDGVLRSGSKKIQQFQGNCHFDKQITFKLKTEWLF